MATTTKKMSGKQAWDWLNERCPKWGSMLVPEASFPYGPQPEAKPLTVGEMEEACGKGAVALARKYCQRHCRSEFGAMYPYAARSVTILENQIAKGWDRERAEKYAAEWKDRYGTDKCCYVVPDGEEVPTDAVHMHYPGVA